MNFYKISSAIKLKIILIIFFVNMLICFNVSNIKAQSNDTTQTSETIAKDSSAKPNKALKMVFKELKKEDSVLPTLGMIAVVFVIVAIAMYISFKDSDAKSKA